MKWPENCTSEKEDPLRQEREVTAGRARSHRQTVTPSGLSQGCGRGSSESLVESNSYRPAGETESSSYKRAAGESLRVSSELQERA